MLIGAPLGRYEIRAKIGEGGMGEVYSARDAELERDETRTAKAVSDRKRALFHRLITRI